MAAGVAVVALLLWSSSELLSASSWARFFVGGGEMSRPRLDGTVIVYRDEVHGLWRWIKQVGV